MREKYQTSLYSVCVCDATLLIKLLSFFVFKENRDERCRSYTSIRLINCTINIHYVRRYVYVCTHNKLNIVRRSWDENKLIVRIVYEANTVRLNFFTEKGIYLYCSQFLYCLSKILNKSWKLILPILRKRLIFTIKLNAIWHNPKLMFDTFIFLSRPKFYKIQYFYFHFYSK